MIAAAFSEQRTRALDDALRTTEKDEEGQGAPMSSPARPARPFWRLLAPDRCLLSHDVDGLCDSAHLFLELAQRN